MPKDAYQLVNLSINPKHWTAPGLEIDGSRYAPNTLFVVEPFSYPVYQQTALVRGQANVQYPNGAARVRHFTPKRHWAGIWLLSDGKNLRPVDHEAHLLDPDGYFISTSLQVFGAPNDSDPVVWPGPSIRALNFKSGQKLVCHVLNAPAEILVYENSGNCEYSVGGSGNAVICHANRPTVLAKDCARSSTVRMSVLSEGSCFRAVRSVKQNTFGTARGLKYLGDMGVIGVAGYGSDSNGHVNVCMDFIGGVAGGIRNWKEGWHRHGVYLDNFANGNSVQTGVVMFDLDIGLNLGGGWNNSAAPIRTVQVARPIVDENRSHFQQVQTWSVAIPSPRVNKLAEPASYDSAAWLYSSPHFAVT